MTTDLGSITDSWSLYYTEKELENVRIEKPSWRRWPIVFLFSLYGCHYSFQVSFKIIK